MSAFALKIETWNLGFIKRFWIRVGLPVFILVFLSNFSIVSSVLRMLGSLPPQPLPKVVVSADGKAVTNIPLEIPPGTKGIEPKLSLTYASEASNGILGRGWILEGNDFIVRDPSFGVKYSGSDSYISSIGGQLVDISGSKSIYHSRKETFVRYYPNGTCGDGPCSWTAIDKTGLTYTFGGTSDSQILAIGQSGAIRIWAVSKVQDPFGNGYTVQYTQDGTGAYYPAIISYNNRSIQFSYESRPDVIPDYSQGTIVNLTQRLNTISVYTNGSLLREYEFGYSQGTVTGGSLLAWLRRDGNNAFGNESYDDLVFTYNSQGNGGFSSSLVSYGSFQFGDGTDVFIPNPNVLLSQTSPQNNLPEFPIPSPSTKIVTGMQYTVQIPVSDRNSCNIGLLACACILYAPCWHYDPIYQGNLQIACSTYNAWGGYNSCTYGVKAALTGWLQMDVNGDGVLDFVALTGDEMTGTIHLSATPIKYNGIPTTFTSSSIPIHYNTFYSVADIDGNGMTDFVYENGGTLWVVYSYGTSFSSPQNFSNVSLNTINGSLTSFNPYMYVYNPAVDTKQLTSNIPAKDYLADMNGDGLEDFIHYDGSSFQIYINKKGSFASPIGISAPQGTYLNQFQDIDGDGKAEYVTVTVNFTNANIQALQQAVANDNTKLSGLQTDYNNQLTTLNAVFAATSSSNLPSNAKIQSLVSYYQADTVDNFSADISLLNQVLAGTATLPLASTKLTGFQNDLQSAYSQLYSPVLQDLQTQQSALNSAIAVAYANNQAQTVLQVSYFNLSNGTANTITNTLSASVDAFRSFLVDMNGDGRADLVSIIGNEVIVYLNTVSGFASPNTTALNTSDGTKVNQFNFGDVNGDKLNDLVLYNISTQRIETYLSNGKSFNTMSGVYNFGALSSVVNKDNNGYVTSATTYQITVQDLNGDSAADVSVGYLSADLTSGQIFYSLNSVRTSPEDSLANLANGTGQTTNILYGLVSAQSGGVRVGSGSYPNLPNTTPDFVVTSLVEDLTNGITNNSVFTYKDSRFYLGVRGIARSLGFASIQETDLNTGFYSVNAYNQSSYRLSGQKDSESRYNSSGNLVQQTLNSGYTYPNPFGTEIEFPTNVSLSYYQNGSLYLTKNQAIAFDSYGNAISSTETAGSHTLVTQNTYFNDTTNWRMGRVLETKTFVDGGLSGDTLLTYNGDLVFSKTEFPGTSAALSTGYTYDSYGNPISVTDPAGAATTFVYDTTLNLFQTQKTNALGHTTSITYNLDLGVPISATDANGAVSYKTYDGYKRPLTVTFAGESSWNESFTYNNVGRFDLTNLSNNESVTKQIRDNVTGTTSILTSYIDPLGNEVRSEANTPVAGVNLINETSFDYIKRVVSRKSNTYVTGITPSYSQYYYAHPDNLLSSVDTPDAAGTITTSVTYSGLTTTMNRTYPGGTVRTNSQVKNELGQVISKTDNGKTLSYTYETHGQLSSATDPEGNVSTFGYDSAGRKISSRDPNSGAVNYTFDSSGRISTQTDARGKTLTFGYDALSRISSMTPSGGETPVLYTYDDPTSSFGKGRLSHVSDGTGTTSFNYNVQGRTIEQKKTIDDLIVFVRSNYDSLGRPLTITYPDGTKIHNNYSVNNYISDVSMDSADGTSTGYTVVSYQGPILGSANPIVRRTTGNGVTMDISFEPIHLRPMSIVTKKSDGTTLGNVNYAYDSIGNIASITDNVTPQRNESFSYDSWNRLVQATGIYGTQNYSYTDGGKLTQKGDIALSYSDSNHVNAVTQSNSTSTGPLSYSYDASGNMISRNGDTLRYDSFGKMVEYDPNGGGQFLYYYDFAGTRVKKVSATSGVVTYSFGDLYEIVRNPGNPEQHTLYIRGNQGDLVSQVSRNNAVLISSNENAVNVAKSNLADQICSAAIGGTCQRIWKENVVKGVRGFFAFSAFFHRGIPTDLFAISYYLFLLVLLYAAYPLLLKGNEILQRAKLLGFSAPVLLLSFVVVFTVQNCNGFLSGSGKGSPPWILIPGASSDPSTPTLNNPQTASGGGINAGSTPVNGMYFYHPNHLGSTVMLTDGYGNPAPGPGQSGVSHVTYEPYGSIVRNDSLGPDIFRYKFTGQQEDLETNLLYYRARHYDPNLGRFIEADRHVNFSSVNGMDKYMYVGGNPVDRIDPSGNSWLSGAIAGLGKSILGGFTALLKGLGRTLSTISKLSFRNLGTAIAHSDYGVGLTRLGYGLRNSDLGKMLTRNREAIYETIGAFFLLPVAGLAIIGATIINPVGTIGYIGGGLSKSSFNNMHWRTKAANRGFQNGTKIQLGLDAAGILAAGAVEFGVVDAISSGFDSVLATIDSGIEWLGDNWVPFTDAVEGFIDKVIDKAGEAAFRVLTEDYSFGWTHIPYIQEVSIPLWTVPWGQGAFAYGLGHDFNYSKITLGDYLGEVAQAYVEDMFTLALFNSQTPVSAFLAGLGKVRRILF
ncbi:hypothetical protein EHO61_05300 [Leptospira fluminis]|uniref:Teneurin-like YD-shell domain-containing protein n=1 Tax=Leptospira fluminis TaxID=2484979 RepID=A0A4R9GSW7_9LEPT|nr:RHS repeat-associated core domain-containing protein [Leptospira fluminis]TGK20300.1 hypothetical protein EHO61_05300 [Leptospira fluminis]